MSPSIRKLKRRRDWANRLWRWQVVGYDVRVSAANSTSAVRQDNFERATIGYIGKESDGGAPWLVNDGRWSIRLLGRDSAVVGGPTIVVLAEKDQKP